VCRRSVNQRNIGTAASTERVAKSCNQLKACGTTAYNYNAMWDAIAARPVDDCGFVLEMHSLSPFELAP
jgi:hypothetical protein